MNQAKLNTHYAHLIFSCLKQQGIDSVFVAPGSRSSPLALASHHYFKSFITHFDERSLAFMALGKIKADHKPVCVITTSGSALGNLLPAIMEASLKHYPLILITADRPQEFHHRGANQTLKQSDIFKDYTVFNAHLEAPHAPVDDKALSSLLTHVVDISKKGPVHLNIALSEPLFDPSVDFPHDVQSRQIVKSLKSLDFKEKKGCIILGENALQDNTAAQFYDNLSQKLDTPIFADISSGYRSFGLPSVFYYNLILDHLEMDFDYVLHFGAKLVSRSLENFLKKFKGTYYHVCQNDEFYDPYNRIDITIKDVLNDEFLNLTSSSETFLREKFYNLNSLLQAAVNQFIQDYPSYQEAEYIELLSKLQEPSWQIFCGNSLPIRHMDSFFFPTHPSFSVHTQRGVSGIDGLISTACGLSLNGKLTWALLGDLSSLYDASALSLISSQNLPVIVIVFNNHGGGIFSHLPVAKQTAHFDKIIATSHKLHFKDIAHGFDLDHILISSLEEFEAFLKNPRPYTLLEVVSSKEGNVEFLEGIKNHLCSFVKDIKKLPCPLSSCMGSWDHTTMENS